MENPWKSTWMFWCEKTPVHGGWYRLITGGYKKLLNSELAHATEPSYRHLGHHCADHALGHAVNEIVCWLKVVGWFFCIKIWLKNYIEESWSHVWLLSGAVNKKSYHSKRELSWKLYQAFHESQKSREYTTWNFKTGGLVHHFPAPLVPWSLSICACIKGRVTRRHGLRVPNITKPGKGTAGFRPLGPSFWSVIFEENRKTKSAFPALIFLHLLQWQNNGILRPFAMISLIKTHDSRVQENRVRSWSNLPTLIIIPKKSSHQS